MKRTIESVSAPFRAIAAAMVPEAQLLGESAWRDLERVADDALATRPAAMHRQLRAFILLLTVLPLLRYRRRLERLSLADRTRFLESIERSPLPILRRGLWGLRTLVFMGFYAREGVAASLGYRATARGWSAIRDA